MRMSAADTLLGLIDELNREGRGADDGALIRALAALDGIDVADGTIDAPLLGTVIAMLVSARQRAADDLAAVQRQRLDADRTVRAITAYLCH